MNVGQKEAKLRGLTIEGLKGLAKAVGCKLHAGRKDDIIHTLSASPDVTEALIDDHLQMKEANRLAKRSRIDDAGQTHPHTNNYAPHVAIPPHVHLQPNQPHQAHQVPSLHHIPSAHFGHAVMPQYLPMHPSGSDLVPGPAHHLAAPGISASGGVPHSSSHQTPLSNGLAGVGSLLTPHFEPHFAPIPQPPPSSFAGSAGSASGSPSAAPVEKEKRKAPRRRSRTPDDEWEVQNGDDLSWLTPEQRRIIEQQEQEIAADQARRRQKPREEDALKFSTLYEFMNNEKFRLQQSPHVRLEELLHACVLSDASTREFTVKFTPEQRAQGDRLIVIPLTIEDFAPQEWLQPIPIECTSHPSDATCPACFHRGFSMWVTVDGGKVEKFPPGWRNKRPDVSLLRQGLRVDLTQLCGDKPAHNVMVEFSNNDIVAWNGILAFFRASPVTDEDLIADVKSRQAWCSPRVVNDPDIEVMRTEDASKYGCLGLDPITRMKINTPVKGIGCYHDDAFDLQTYLAVSEQQNYWNCPICFTQCLFKDLRPVVPE